MNCRASPSGPAGGSEHAMAEQWKPAWGDAGRSNAADEWEIVPEGLRRRPPGPEAAGQAPREAGPPAAPPVLVVSPSGPADCRSVQDAVRRAAPGTRILVRPGVYEEGLVLEKPLEIIGDGPRDEIVLTSYDAHCVSMRTTHAVVRGLTLRSRGACK